MKYTSFQSSDEKGINEFLASNSEKIVQGGVVKFEDRIGFMYLDEPKKADMLLEAMKEGILKLKLEYSSVEVGKRIDQRNALRGEKVGAKIVQAENRKETLANEIRVTEELLKEYEENGGWKTEQPTQVTHEAKEEQPQG